MTKINILGGKVNLAGEVVPAENALPLDLDLDSPYKVADVLRKAADAYNDSHNELICAWQSSWTPWAAIARILEQAADRIDKSL